MTDRHVHDDLSRAFDGELDASQQAEFQAHLAVCGECAAAYADLQLAVGALRGLDTPVLAAGEVEALVGAAFGPAGGRARRSGASLWVTHAAVLAAGLAAGLLLGLLAAWRWSSAPPAPVTQTVEVVREVPVEVVREVEVPVRVEVPVERVVIERVEVPVEVERIVREPYAVPSPLQPRFDEVLGIVSTVADIAGQSALAFERAVDAAIASAALRDGPTYGTVVADGSGVDAKLRPKQGDDVVAASRAPLVVRRDGARVQILTRGGPEDFVPALLDALESDDGAVVAAALDRLRTLRAELEDGGPVAALAAVGAPGGSVTSPGGIRGLFGAGRGRATEERDPAAAWRLWWEERAR